MNETLTLVTKIEGKKTAVTERNELIQKIETTKEDIDQQKRDSTQVYSEMVRQFKTMQADLIMRINEKENEVIELREQLGFLPLSFSRKI